MVGANPFSFAGGGPSKTEEKIPSFLKQPSAEKQKSTVNIDDLMNMKADNFTLGTSHNQGFNQSQ